VAAHITVGIGIVYLKGSGMKGNIRLFAPTNYLNQGHKKKKKKKEKKGEREKKSSA
jgi:hypothetical protein